MHDELATPWFDRALERLELRRGNRVLALEPRQADIAALRRCIGDDGELTVTLRDRQQAEQLALGMFNREVVDGRKIEWRIPLQHTHPLVSADPGEIVDRTCAGRTVVYDYQFEGGVSRSLEYGIRAPRQDLVTVAGRYDDADKRWIRRHRPRKATVGWDCRWRSRV